MNKYVAADKIYKANVDRKIQYYTEEYLERFGGIQSDIENNKYWTRGNTQIPLIEADYEETKYRSGTIVNCTYAQLFWPESALILCNNMRERLYDQLELESGTIGDEEGEEYDIFQYYIIDDETAESLCGHTTEIVFYDRKLDVYVLGVTHCGTSWTYVPAQYKC